MSDNKPAPRRHITRGRLVITLPHDMLERLRTNAAASRRTLGGQVEFMLAIAEEDYQDAYKEAYEKGYNDARSQP